MSAPGKTQMTAEDYEHAAQEYQASLPLEHYMEGEPQATQREITVASFALVRRARADFRYFNELLVQYFFEGTLKQVVPDNMVVLGKLDGANRSSYATELESAPIFWTLEYVSPNNKRKDYVDNFQQYQYELKVPYYLLFDPATQDLQLHRHDGTSYQLQEANAAARYPLPELELEVGLLNRWVRYWHRGELLPLPAELRNRLDEHAERIRELENQVKAKEKQLEAQAEQITAKEKQIKAQAEQLRQRDQQQEGLVALLRPAVEVKARQAGRQDNILERLPATTDGALLARWLTELA